MSAQVVCDRCGIIALGGGRPDGWAAVSIDAAAVPSSDREWELCVDCSAAVLSCLLSGDDRSDRTAASR